MEHINENRYTGLGYIVLEADNGLSGLSMYQEHRERIELVVLDMKMPNMSGKECVIKIIKNNPNAKILISSGHVKGSLCQSLPLSEL